MLINAGRQQHWPDYTLHACQEVNQERLRSSGADINNCVLVDVLALYEQLRQNLI